MTQTSPAPVTGQDIGVAARATRAVLEVLLTEEGTDFLTWAALNTLATSGGAMAPGALEERLTAGIGADGPSIAAILDRLGAAGLVREAPGQAGAAGAVRLELTPDGQALHQRLRAGIARLTARLHDGLDPDDLATTRRVLLEVAERANAALAARDR